MWYSAGKPVVRRGRGVRVRTRPRWLCAENEHAPDAEHFDSLLHFIYVKRPRTVALRRGFGLGDLLMLLPVVKALHRQTGVEIIVVSRRDWAETFGEMDLPGISFVRDRGKGVDYGADCHICLNGALQADHQGPPAADHHRCELYSMALGFSGLGAAA